MSHKLPLRPDNNHLKHQAKNLLKSYRTGDAAARRRFELNLLNPDSKTLAPRSS